MKLFVDVDPGSYGDFGIAHASLIHIEPISSLAYAQPARRLMLMLLLLPHLFNRCRITLTELGRRLLLYH